MIGRLARLRGIPGIRKLSAKTSVSSEAELLRRADDFLGADKTSSDEKAAMFANEVKDAAMIFDGAWKAVEERVGGGASFPKEVLWLGGAPGSGKGTNTGFILRERGLTAEPVVMSSLLNSPAAEAVKAAGGMVGDKEVVQALFETLLDPVYSAGVVVDGFPRTKVQAEVTRMLFDKLTGLYGEEDSSQERPIFRIVVLFVDEMTRHLCLCVCVCACG